MTLTTETELGTPLHFAECALNCALLDFPISGLKNLARTFRALDPLDAWIVLEVPLQILSVRMSAEEYEAFEQELESQ